MRSHFGVFDDDNDAPSKGRQGGETRQVATFNVNATASISTIALALTLVG